MVYSFANIDDQSGQKITGSDSLCGWEAVAANSWRNISQIGRPSDIIAIGDAMTFYFALHGHRHARDSLGRSWQIETATDVDNRGTHPSKRLPVAFLGGNGAALPLTSDCWENGQHDYPTPGAPGSPTTLFLREAEKLVWFVR